MGLPTKQKNWQIDANLLYPSPEMDDLKSANPRYWLAFKNALVGFASNAWQVDSACDSITAGNNDGVDRWSNVGDLVWASSGNPHSWIVLRQAALGNASLCIDLNDPTTTHVDGSIIVSPSAGFGAANGGADGTTTARPTATDEDVLVSTATVVAQTSGTLSAAALHVWMSDDGTVTRAIVTRFNQIRVVFWFEQPRNPISAWTTPLVYAYRAEAGALNFNDFFTGAYWRFVHSGSFGDMAASLPGIAGNTTEEVNTDAWAAKFPYAFSNRSLMAPATYYSETLGLTGQWAMAMDAYTTPNLSANGYIIRDDQGSPAWVKMGKFWLPWSAAAGRVVT